MSVSSQSQVFYGKAGRQKLEFWVLGAHLILEAQNWTTFSNPGTNGLLFILASLPR